MPTIPELDLEKIEEPNFRFSTLLFLGAILFCGLKIYLRIFNDDFYMPLTVSKPEFMTFAFFTLGFIYSIIKLGWRCFLYLREQKEQIVIESE